MDPNNYRIHKRPQPSYRPRQQQPLHSRVTPRPAPVNTPLTPHQKTPKQTTNNPYNRVQQPISMPPRPSASKAEYTITAPVQSAPKSKKQSKHKILKRFIIFLIVLAVLGSAAAAGYYYYKKSGTPVKADTEQTNQTPTSVDFTLYKTKEGSLFKSGTNYEPGKQQSQILTANSTKDNRQVVITQQKVDKYFTTDPNGLDNLVKTTGANNAVSTNYGMSYIVTGNTTALTVRGETLIIVRSTGELTTQEWVGLFNSLESSK